MSKWLSVLVIAAGLTVLRGVVMFVTGSRPYTPTVEQCLGQDGQIFWPVSAVLFYVGSAFICIVFWPVIYDAMSRTAYQARLDELNVARWMLCGSIVLEGGLGLYWGSMSCYDAAMPHVGMTRVTSLMETVLAGVIFYATFVAQRDARRFVPVH